MKLTLSILALSVLLFAGCTPITKEELRQLEFHYGEPKVLEFDSCEYVVISVDGYRFGIAHKGNCKYCEQRRKEVRQ
jgi:hypothetical protein